MRNWVRRRMSAWRRRPSLRIGEVVLLLSLAVSGVAVLVVFTLSFVIERKAIEDLAVEEARQTSKLVFESLYSAMSKGWTRDEITGIIGRLNEIQPDMRINVVRGAAVIEQYGDVAREHRLREDSPRIRRALETGEEQLIPGDSSIRYLYPVKVEEECQRCHDAPLGAVNGVVDVTYPVNNLKISLGFVINTVITYFVIILVVLSVIIYLKLRYFVVRPVVGLAGVIKEIIQHTDLDRRVDTSHVGIHELDELTSYFNRLLNTVQDYHAKLEEFSVRDPLTGLYNRRKFEEFLHYEVHRAGRHGHNFCIAMLDLDNFKHINDTFGHPVGDLALKELSAILHHATRNSDIVARLGGDEFAVLFPETDREGGHIAARKLLEEINSAAIQLPVGTTKIESSVGLVSFPENGEDSQNLVVAMDIAMYRAKRAGKNRVATIEEGEETYEMEVFTKGQELRQALDEDRLIPFFQPLMDLETGKPYAYEVLARIENPDGSTQSAGQFIELADELGLSGQIDITVFEKGLAALAAHEDGAVKMFFNLSSKSMGDSERLRALPDVIRGYGLDTTRVVLEITEREALPHFRHFVQIMEELRGEGLGFALDDFGSGFSSFLYLKYLEVDYVKIEGSFIRHIAEDPKDSIIVEYINGMAKRFGLHTVAEFVEDAQSVALLRELKVELGQGYHFGLPSADMTVRPKGE